MVALERCCDSFPSRAATFLRMRTAPTLPPPPLIRSIYLYTFFSVSVVMLLGENSIGQRMCDFIVSTAMQIRTQLRIFFFFQKVNSILLLRTMSFPLLCPPFTRSPSMSGGIQCRRQRENSVFYTQRAQMLERIVHWGESP